MLCALSSIPGFDEGKSAIWSTLNKSRGIALVQNLWRVVSMPWKFWFTVTQPPSDNGPLHQPSSCLGFPAWFTSPSCMHNSHLPSLKMNSSYCAKGIAENSWGFCTEPLRKPLAPHSSPVHPSGMLCSLLLFSNVMFSLLVFTFSSLTLVFPYGAARRDQTYWVPLFI